MRVLLIQPPESNAASSIIPKYVSEQAGSYPPLGLLYAAAAALKAGHRVEVLDAKLEGLTYPQITERVAAAKPDLVGITATTFTAADARLTARAAKASAPAPLVCIGGPHTSIYPLETLAWPEVDCIVFGEGEVSFPELLSRLAAGEAPQGVAGTGYKAGGEPVLNAPRAFVEEMDSIPFPARELINVPAYRSLLGGKRVFTTIMSSRGCPFNCLYCYHAFGRRFRMHSSEYMVREVKACLEAGITEFWYFDDNFTVDRRRLLEFCAALRREGLEIGWHIRTRIDLLDREVMEALRAAGCERMSIGVESGVEKTIQRLRKKIDLGQVRENIRLARSLGFEVYLDFMIGSPGETREEVLKTIAYAAELDPDYAQFAVTTPYPDTDLYREGLKSGVIKEDHWAKFAKDPFPGFQPPTINEFMDRAELTELLNLAYRRFYFRPWYIFRRVLSVRSFREFFTKARAAIAVFRESC